MKTKKRLKLIESKLDRIISMLNRKEIRIKYQLPENDENRINNACVEADKILGRYSKALYDESQTK